MITAPAAFTAALNQNSRHFDAKIIHNGAEVDCDIQNIASKKGAQDGQTFSIGSVFSSSAEITCSGLTDNLLNEDIEIQIGVLLSDGTYSYITYGQFTVINAPKTAYQTILSCVGFISSKLGTVLPAVGDNPSILSIALAIQTATGIQVTFPDISSSVTNTLAQPISGVSCRAALAIIAFLVGGYATENASGGVEIHQYKLPQTRQPVLAENCLTAPIVAEERFNMTGIKVVVNPEVYTLTTDITIDTSKTYYERSGDGTDDDPYVYTRIVSPTGNPASQGWYEITEIAYSSGSPIRQTYSSPYMTQAIFNDFASTVVGLTFDPAEIDNSVGNPLFEPWDCLTVTDVNGTTQYTVPCHLIESTFDGGFFSEIRSIGESISDLPVEGSLTQKVDETVQQLAATQAATAQAKAAANAAKAYAQEAKITTDEINDYAETAGKTVTQILSDGEEAGANALEAKKSASEAFEQAQVAYGASTTAITQLGVVENIIGVLDLLSKNGTYTLTQDTSAQNNKWYFTRSGSGTTEDPYLYNVVTVSENDNPNALGYYELIGIDSAIQNYVSSHLALDDQGLNLQNGSTRLLLSTDDGLVFYDQNGTQVAKYGTGATIGDEYGFHIKITNRRLSFYRDSTHEVAYISGDKLYITQSVVLQQMDVGDPVSSGGLGQWSWKVHDVNGANNLYLKWLG